jgi:predicted RNA binding protein YcfA (HicA-like mRNA interferase family)
MKPITGKKFEKILKKKGWILLRVHGSHHIYGKEGSVERLSVPVHGSKLLKAGLLTHLAKMAGIAEEELI